MPDPLLRAWCAVLVARAAAARRLDDFAGDERGEGVISAAIAVLIMAALGVVMWVGFQEIWGDAKTNTQNEVTKIGS